MKTKTINLYNFSELSQEAKDKARNAYNEHNDYSFMEEFMEDKLADLLAVTTLVPEAGSKPKILYSLSHSQGDGVCFIGTFTWKNKYTVFISHSGHYYHSSSTLAEIQESDNLGIEIGDDYEPELYKEFDTLYQKICKELERYGYDLIETEDSEENFSELCSANDYTFREDGTMENA